MYCSWGSAIEGDVIQERINDIVIRTYAHRPVNLPSTLEKSTQLYPDKVAIVSGDIRLTYQEFYNHVLSVAIHLQAKCKFDPGERLAIVLKNTIEFCIMVYAAHFARLVVVPVSTKLQPDEVATLLNDADVVGIVVESRNQMGTLKPLLSKDVKFFYESTIINCLGKKHSEFEPLEQPKTHDPAFIMYTSGTTGHSKGVILSHFNVIHGAMNYERCYGLTSDDSTILAVPIFHGTGLVAQLVTFVYLGGTIVLLEKFNATEMLKLCEQECITHTICVPTIYNLLMQEPSYRSYNLRLRVLGTGGAPISLALFQRIREWLPSAHLLNTYGLTEATSPALMTPKEVAVGKIGSVGMASPVIECKIVDIENLHPVPSGEVGEILLKGALITTGYWNKPVETRQTILDGWLRTGDVGWMDEDGFVYLCDRIKDMINRGGEKVYSIEVEDVISSHPDVLEAAVVGVADELYGEVVKVCIVLVQGRQVTGEEIIRWATERLAKFKVPRYVEFRDSLPRNASGKVIKRALS